VLTTPGAVLRGARANTDVCHHPQPSIHKAEFFFQREANRIRRSAAIQGLACKSALAVKTRAILNSIAQLLLLPLLYTSNNGSWSMPTAVATLFRTVAVFCEKLPRYLADRRSYESLKGSLHGTLLATSATCDGICHQICGSWARHRTKSLNVEDI